MPLFDVGALDPAKAVEFYRHEMDWTNRMILGDSLVVMASLLERERLAGRVQCVYMDPPYGIKYQSNFQPRISSRAVKDGSDEDLTREPEMIQAYRDTWELGVHSYLTYLRDRFTMARELLTDSGSIFIQIGEENVHLARTVLDEVFGSANFVSMITFATTTGTGAPGDVRSIPNVENYVLWYSKDREQLKFWQLYLKKVSGGAGTSGYTKIRLADGSEREATEEERLGSLPSGARLFMVDNLVSAGWSETSSQPYVFQGVEFSPGKGHWKTSRQGLDALAAAARLRVSGSRLGYLRFADDFPAMALTNIWTDVSSGFLADKRYVVQTNPSVIARCILMTTDPGDLVLDPTCGSGTTALVAEEFGRRWITLDTSRVALSIARERMLTSTFPYYELRDSEKDVDGGFVYESLSRVTLRSIARGEGPETVTLVDRPKVEPRRVRVSGPFTVEALSRYAVNPTDISPGAGSEVDGAADHVEILLSALRVQGVPRPGSPPAKIESLAPLVAAGALQAEGVLDVEGKKVRFAVSLGPRFGAITMAQVSDALQAAVGYGMIVFAGFAVSADSQAQLGTGKVGGVEVALLLANPDLLAGDLLKNTAASQTFRLYASPDVSIEEKSDGCRVTVEGVDSYDAATGRVVSFGRQGIQGWFLDDDFDGKVFRVSQAFFPVSNGWEKLSRALRGTVDAELVEELHSWTSLPFDPPQSGRIAVRVVSNDGNAAEVIREIRGRKDAAR